MKKKILFNIGFVLTLVILIYFLQLYINALIGYIYRIIDIKTFFIQDENTIHAIELLKKSIIAYSIYLFLFLLITAFMVFMLIYINKKDITVLSASVVDKMKEQRKQKAKEKKQQKIDALEEKLKQLKKDE